MKIPYSVFISSGGEESGRVNDRYFRIFKNKYVTKKGKNTFEIILGRTLDGVARLASCLP